ncbi:putative pleckstrin homology domain containing protein [Lyophyllum shimeji]|uniref:Pleckstrin homology domain containing protein n=1 Tax=Lyophyllum shimeji TaxID=47721 RepID=A0A9P3UPN3_LYOSH|nr:putative pleckstrin homology domain containing protein [Lyophyllum shimeji]
MASNHPPASIAISAAHQPPHDPKHYDTHRRVFIGPMPEKVISQTEAHVKKKKEKRGLFRHTSRDEPDDDVSEIIKQNAFTFFMNEGGRPEDWGEDEEQNVVEEMFHRWRDSEWARIWQHRREHKTVAPTSHWVGGSFEIGRFLGVNILSDAASTRERMSVASGSERRASLASSRPSQDRPLATISTTKHDTYATAPSGSHPPPSMLSRLKTDAATPETLASTSRATSHLASSSTSLLRPALERINADGGPKAQSEVQVPPSPTMRTRPSVARSEGAIVPEGKGKGRLVHYADMPPEQPPAPPTEVLERAGGASFRDTSAGAAASISPASPSPPSLDWGDVVMRDRMLVRTCYTKYEHISPQFDEVQHRMTQNLVDADCGEYMVAWRRDRIELYRDYRILAKEWLFGHKNLAFVIPLKSARTHLSLYSFVDLTFCLQCQPARPERRETKTRWSFTGTKEGTNIFIFKHKNRSRAYDWIWQIWRQLGGQIPSTVEVRNLRMNTRVRIDVPSDGGEISQVLSRANAIALCKNVLSSVPGWNELIEREMIEGKSLELAWRMDTNLDWIWLDDDVAGEERREAVLCGLALKQLTRIRPNTQQRQPLYLATHDGNLFVMNPHHAHPPTPPGLAQHFGDTDACADTLRTSEVKRGALQIMHATGVNDLRNVLLIRRASHPVPEAVHKEASKSQDSDIWFSIWSQSEERSASDMEDEGGEEGLSKAEDKTRLRMRRSFELLLNTGRVVRFEVHSCRAAVEWIERLRALVLYWKQRHRIDAKDEMDLAQSHRSRLTPLTRADKHECEFPPEAPPDTSAPMPALGSLYSWCVLDGCKPIVKGGKLYVRKGLYGQFKFVQLFLAAGHLTQFRIKPRSALHPSMHKKTNLIDAYVCSGYLAAMALPRGQYRARTDSDPRRYLDGLETDDPEEDMLFTLLYRPQPLRVDRPSVDGPPSTTPLALPSLSAKRKLLVFRTRSRLERDAWCWALNCEIEKLAREQKEREAKLRESGKLMLL